MGRALILVVLMVSACGPPMRYARTSRSQPVSERERDAWTRNKSARCSRNWGFLFPGLAQICQNRDTEGGIIAATAAVELGVGIVVGEREGYEHPGAAIPLLAAQDAWLLGLADGIRDEELGALLLYAPQDSLGELAIAPFNGEVMKHPTVWGGILILTALGVGASLLVDETWNTDNLGEDANLFGHTFDPVVGYPLAAGTGAALFTHVAMAEEMVFRGWAQSAMARSWGEWQGWAGASLVFGLAHAPNALLLPEGERREYLLYGVPFITAIGSYLGWVYKRHGYSLAAPVAIHFWYDFLLTATFFAIDPTSSPLSAKISLPF